MAAQPVEPELEDIQGLVARGYGDLTAATFLLGRIEDGAAARTWLAGIANILTAASQRPEGRAVNIAFTSVGLRHLGLTESTVALFSNEFVDGMTTPHRSRTLGDVGRDAPEHWSWGGPSAPVDFVLLLYATDSAELAALRAEPALAFPPGVQLVSELATSNLRGHEPFGFRDGISQPLIEGLSKKGPAATTLKFGEFVLGYPNEYGRLTDLALLERAPEVGRNGSYVVFRQLRQDVRGFWRFLDDAARHPDGTPDPERRLRLAAKLVGRWPGGASLALSPELDDPALSEENDFGYHDLDRRGERCPIGAHVRRANPRDSLDPKPGTDKSLGAQPPTPAPAPWTRVRAAADTRRSARRRAAERAGARAPLHLPEREHLAPVRVRPGDVAEQPEVRRSLRRLRSARRPVRALRRHVHDPVRSGARAFDRRPAVHLGARRRVLLPAGTVCRALPREPLVEALVAGRLVVLDRIQLLSQT